MGELNNKEIIDEIDRVQSQTMKLINATEVVLVITFMCYVIVIIQKIGMI